MHSLANLDIVLLVQRAPNDDSKSNVQNHDYSLV